MIKEIGPNYPFDIAMCEMPETSRQAGEHPEGVREDWNIALESSPVFRAIRDLAAKAIAVDLGNALDESPSRIQFLSESFAEKTIAILYFLDLLRPQPEFPQASLEFPLNLE